MKDIQDSTRIVLEKGTVAPFGACKGQKRAWDPLELRLQVVVNCLI